MQIPPSSAASAAAGNVSQATSKDRASSAAEATADHSPAGFERLARSEASNPDRDAQGGGQGLGRDHRNPQATPTEPTALQPKESLPVSPPEPPSELDIVG